MQVPAQCVWYYNNNMLQMLELENYEIVDLRIDITMELIQEMFRRLYAYLVFNFKKTLDPGLWLHLT